MKTADIQNRSHVAVLSHDAAQELFGQEEAVGKTFTFNGRAFEVVGVLTEDDSMMGAVLGGTSIYLPFPWRAGCPAAVYPLLLPFRRGRYRGGGTRGGKPAAGTL